MSDVNWWLMALAFVLGVALTLALTIRRVKREVPVYGALGRGPGAGGMAAKPADVDAPKVNVLKADAPNVDDVEAPYGAGSIRIASGAATLEGYTVKGNEDSMLYHAPESPSYKQTIAEIWFVDEESAIKGGFNRWDSGKSQREK